MEASLETHVCGNITESENRISLRHNGIPGRARLQVAGLRGNDALKRALDETAAAEAGILRISASAITGNVLVHFDPARELAEIVTSLEGLVEQPPTPQPEKTAAPKEPQAGIFGFLRNLLHGIAGHRETARERHASAQALTPEVALSWHSKDAKEVERFWETSRSAGISNSEAVRRLRLYGPNQLLPIQPRSASAILAEQFVSLPVMLLIGSAALSVATGGLTDAVVIGAVVLLNAGIGFATEYKAERTVLSLLDLSEPEAKVIRESTLQIVRGDEVVPGDLIVLRRGEPVVADARLIASTRLTIDEAVLTGESMPLEKKAGLLEHGPIPLAERCNMVYRGTLVTGGQGVALVVATGRHTEIGKIQQLLAE
ncbi:MAG: ATPase, partial [Acidobacteriia bacterium]|nr:ATPase [Terriglobia bacterium]